MKTAAFFDIDGTLYRDALMIEHFKKLLRYELVDEAIWHNKLKHKYTNWQKRRGDYDDYMLDLAQLYVESLQGIHHRKMEFVTDQVVDLQGDKVYMATRHQINWHKQEGHVIIFISGAPEYLVKRMGERYGVSDFVGTKYLLNGDGTFSGDIIQMWDNQSKQEALLKMVDKHDIDLSKSYAYGDTHGDITMLEQVGHPMAINPTKELFNAIKNNVALSARAKIIVERKDVIYVVTPNTEIMEVPTID